MEVGSGSCVERTMWVCSVVEAMVVETVIATGTSLACLLFVTGSLLNDINTLLKLSEMDGRFPLDELHKMKHPGAANKDASDTEDDGEDEDDDYADDQDDDDDDAGDEDFSGDEGEEEVDPEDDPEANGDGGSDEDEDDDDDDGGEEDGGEDGEEEDEEEEEEEEVPQPPSKKRK